MGKNYVKIPVDLLEWLLNQSEGVSPGLDAPEDILKEWCAHCAKWEEAANILLEAIQTKKLGRKRAKVYIEELGFELDRNVTLAKAFMVLISQGHKPMQIYRALASCWKPGDKLFPSDDPYFYANAVADGKKQIERIEKEHANPMDEGMTFIERLKNEPI